MNILNPLILYNQLLELIIYLYEHNNSSNIHKNDKFYPDPEMVLFSKKWIENSGKIALEEIENLLEKYKKNLKLQKEYRLISLAKDLKEDAFNPDVYETNVYMQIDSASMHFKGFCREYVKLMGILIEYASDL